MLQPADFFFNLANPNAADPAPGDRLNRAGAAFFAGSIVTSIPRQAGAVDKFRLDVQGNRVFTQVTDKHVTPSAVPAANTNVVQTPVNGRILSRVEALNLDAVYVLWATTPFSAGGGSVTSTNFFYAIPQFNESALSAAGTAQPLTFPHAPDGTLTDFTTATANNQIYLFWVASSAPNVISFTQFGGRATTPAEAKPLLTVIEARRIVSIDAAMVQVLDAHGTQSTRIAVVALMDVAGQPQLGGWLFDPDTLQSRTIQSSTLHMPGVPPIPPGQLPNSSIRAAWGTVAMTDTTPLNGLVLVCIPSLDDPAFLRTLGSRAAGQAVGYGSTQMTVVPFPAAAIPAWQDMRPPASNWPMFRNVPATQAATSAGMTALFPLPISDATAVTYYVGLATSSGVMTIQDNQFNFIRDFYYVQFYRAFGLKSAALPSTPRTTGIAAKFSASEASAALASWTLIGMITGLPPYFADQAPGTVSLTHSLDITSGGGSTAAVTKTVTVGGGCLGFSGAFAQAITTATGSTSQVTLTQPTQIQNGTLAPNHGVALYWQPAYQFQDFNISNAVGVPNDLKFHLLWAGDSGGITPVFFTLADLNVPVDRNAINLAFCNFPKAADGISLVRFPLSNAPEQWEEPPPTEAWMSKTLHPVGFFTVTEETSIPAKQLSFGTTQTTQLKNTVNVELSQETPKALEVFGIKFGGTLGFETTVNSTFGVTQTFTFTYQNIPKGDTLASFQVQPFLLIPAVDNAPWVPAVNRTQRPWLLTWQVMPLSEVEPQSP